MENEILITFVSALVAALAFAAFALPLLRRGERKERYKEIIEKRRKVLMESAKKEAANRGQKQMSAGESLAMSFKVEKILGSMGEKIRDRMLQAGIRNPTAPIKFIIARFLIPLGLTAFAMLIISSSDKEVSSSVTMMILLGCMVAGYALPGILLKNTAQKRMQDVNLAFPDALDMMLICVQGGIGLEQTVARIADEISEHSPTLAEELGILSAEMAMLNDRRTALQDFARRMGSGAAKSFATALIQAEQYGTSVSQAMRVMADEMRDQRMALAEQKAASLPPKLTVPMILFFLPVLFVIILGPAIIQIGQTF
ncbi:MAG: type II secretion system F family protein [Alphaproteobacteria bacterium]|nr:type II secretion system F family protein [Alphaproteobacteria bacterium]